jgi:L-ascorbate metabolism protein UlaG (beta-lactamase superfamily)
VYFSGVSGYSDTFKIIGQRYGPFDIAFLENGAYNLDWAQIHLMPEETVQASIDLKARLLFPIHWSKFDLALHPWDEPAIRLTREATIRNVTVASPLIGEVFDVRNYPETRWWESLRAEIEQIISSLRS